MAAAVRANIADALFERAAESPERIALRWRARGFERALSYRALADEVEALAAGLRAIGVRDGLRTAVMVRPGRSFFTLMFALFRARAVPVLIDPGIDRRALSECLAEAAPEAFVGIPLAHVARIVRGWARDSVRILVTVDGRRWFWRGHTYASLLRRGRRGMSTPLPEGEGTSAASDGELAAILFTSGSTGVPKGVEYTHAQFAAQVGMIRAAFGIEPGEVDLPTFAPFALFDPALGSTTVLPRIDFARPGTADPRELHESIAKHRVTSMFGSPAVVGLLAAHGAPLRGLKRIVSAGAPVRPEVVRALRALLDPAARVYTPYGATECLPVAIVESQEILAHGAVGTARGTGILVGRPVPPNLVRIVAIDDGAIPDWTGARVLAPGEIGEITVAGPTVTERYFRRAAATARAKILEATPEGTRTVHRMGDLGCFDADGRLWYAGRLTHRVATGERTYFTEPVEGIFNAHPEVARTALVGVGARGAQQAVLCVELRCGVPRHAWPRIARELAALGDANPVTRGIADFRQHRRFPVDARHNAKIGREKLAGWAAAGDGRAR